jgi:ParB family chromosome partitioning protein
MEKRRLGRGLNALIGGDENAVATPADAEVPLDRIQQNPYQPRKSFDPDELASLTASVRIHGILQPVVVRPVGDHHYELIAGERRLRAAQQVGMSKIPVHVVNFNDQEVFEAALVENIQRSDLNAIEKAQGFKDYLDRFGMTYDQVAARLGLARSTISNLIHFLDLAPEVQEGLRLGQITEGHAKLLKGIKSQERQVAVFKQIVAMGLSVKAVEAVLRDRGEPLDPEPRSSRREASNGSDEKTNHIRGVEDELRQKLAVPVEIKVKGTDRGQIILDFESNDDFERLLEQLRR